MWFIHILWARVFCCLIPCCLNDIHLPPDATCGTNLGHVRRQETTGLLMSTVNLGNSTIKQQFGDDLDRRSLVILGMDRGSTKESTASTYSKY